MHSTVCIHEHPLQHTPYLHKLPAQDMSHISRLYLSERTTNICMAPSKQLIRMACSSIRPCNLCLSLHEMDLFRLLLLVICCLLPARILCELDKKENKLRFVLFGRGNAFRSLGQFFCQNQAVTVSRSSGGRRLFIFVEKGRAQRQARR